MDKLPLILPGLLMRSIVLFDTFRSLCKARRISLGQTVPMGGTLCRHGVVRSFRKGSARFFGLSVVALLFFSAAVAAAQEVPFTPRYDGLTPQAKRAKKTPTPKVEPARAPQLYSLGRFNLLFQEMCQLLEREQRRERIFVVAKAAAEDEQECPACRALTRQVAQSCAPKARIKKAAAPSSPGEEPATGTLVGRVKDARAEDKLLNRFPRTDLIDVLSRLSDGLYEFTPGQGPVFMALKSFELRLFAVPDLTIGEKEYYGIVLSYLFSAWAGRPGSPLEIATPSPEEVADLFKH